MEAAGTAFSWATALLIFVVAGNGGLLLPMIAVVVAIALLGMPVTSFR
ncbi:MAG: hypothetical protein H0W07_08825 [Chloroflexi bacterium]|nr:hypothetical protein [Chloroflexota bacterium]